MWPFRRKPVPEQEKNIVLSFDIPSKYCKEVCRLYDAFSAKYPTGCYHEAAYDLWDYIFNKALWHDVKHLFGIGATIIWRAANSPKIQFELSPEQHAKYLASIESAKAAECAAAQEPEASTG